SEIGSEGRNFQFAHHLVLFDLPENPELLEQRIGRLDRIGQSSTIHLHVPFVRGTTEEAWARWYHEGLDAFSHSLHGASQIVRELGGDWTSSLSHAESEAFIDLLKRTRRALKQIGQRLDRGYNRLLELSSCNAVQARRLVAPVRDLDERAGFESFVIRLAEGQGMHVEELSLRTWFLRPDNISGDAVPGVPRDGMTFTFDRQRALSREHEGFLTCDHPLTRGLLDLLLGARTGNCAFAVWRNSGEDGLLLEAHFVIECVAPAAWQIDRFLPPTPARAVVDHASRELTKDAALEHASLGAGEVAGILERSVVRKKLLPAMLAEAERLAAREMKQVISTAVTAMNRQVGAEIERLEDLAQVNPHVTPREIDAFKDRRQSLSAAIMNARLRLDSLRLILRRA
ncbi:MAG TPA: helicase-related protein, partial [Verrucomicrobiaceae bacterium]